MIMLLLTLWWRRHPKPQNMVLRGSSYVRLSVSLLSVLFCRKFDLPKEGGRPLWWDGLYSRPNSSHSYERGCSLRSRARALFLFASGTQSFNLFSPGSPPKPNENIKVISAPWSKKKKSHCGFVYLLFLTDGISQGRKSSVHLHLVDVIGLILNM